MERELEVLLAERAIERVILQYARGADRRELELMRACFWPDGTDDHGSFVGGVDDFVEFVRGSLTRFERTCHFIGNILIDADLDANEARAETYCVAYHRMVNAAGEAADMIAGLRYVDRFERRGGEWRIARRVCAYEWRRTEPATGEGFSFADGYERGQHGEADIIHRIMQR